MCGIVAAISRGTNGFGYKAEAIFTQLLYANALRGFDSTGVFGVNKYGNLKLHKMAGQAVDFLKTHEAGEFIKDIWSHYRVVVGHNRAATKGAVVDDNAHPFMEEHICLVHNGTLHSHKHLKDVEVDSHAITHALVEKDYREVLPNLNGAYALIWYNAKTKKLHIARNTERPLWIVSTSTADFIASEDKMLEWILDRSGVTKVEAKYFKPGVVYTYDMENLQKGFEEETLPVKKSTSVVPFHSGGTSGGTKGIIYKNYRYGDKLIVEIETCTELIQGVEGSVVIRGKILDSNYLDFQCIMSQSEYDMLVAADSYSCVVTGVSIKNEVAKIMVKDLQAEHFFLSCNNVMVSAAELDEVNCTCDQCGTLVNPEKEEFWVRYKHKVKALRCEECVKADPILSKYLKQEKTDEK